MGPGAGVLPRPPAPVLSFPGPFYWSVQTGLDDFGGRIEVWWSASGDAPWTVGTWDPWARTKNWFELAGLKGLWIAVVEIGNGEVYAGISALSNKLFVPV